MLFITRHGQTDWNVFGVITKILNIKKQKI